MVTNQTTAREPGRPRTFSDEDAFLATANALARLGYGRLTLEAVADQIGCTRQALVRRFGSKHALVLAYLGWVNEAAAERYRAARRVHPSPLAALRARFLLPVAERPYEVADPVGQGNIVAFFVGSRDDPEFRPLLARLMEIYHAEVTGLLIAAGDAGDLALPDPAALAHTLIAATTGELVLWAANPDGTAVERIARVFDAVVAPYRAGGR